MIENKRITILCQHFYPEEASTGQFATELAEDLSGYGYQVSAITAQPTYFLRTNKKLEDKSYYRNITIYRTNNTRFNRKNVLGRLANSLSYLFFTFFTLFLSSPQEVLLVYTNPPFLALTAFLSKLIRRQRYLVVVYDVYPDASFKTGYFRYLRFFRFFFNLVNASMFNSAEKVIAIGKCMVSLLRARGIKADKIVYIPNWADGDFIKPLAKDKNPLFSKYRLNEKFIVKYSGAFSLYHDFDTLVEAAEKLIKLPILFLFISSGLKVDLLKEEVEKKKLKNFLFLPYQPKEALKYTLTLGDVGLVIQRNDFQGINVPAKLYSYLAAGLGIIGLIPLDSEAAQTIEESNCGFVVSPSDPEDLAKKIERLFKDRELLHQMGKRGRLALEAKYDRKIITWQYKEVFDRIISLKEL